MPCLHTNTCKLPSTTAFRGVRVKYLAQGHINASNQGTVSAALVIVCLRLLTVFANSVHCLTSSSVARFSDLVLAA